MGRPAASRSAMILLKSQQNTALGKKVPYLCYVKVMQSKLQSEFTRKAKSCKVLTSSHPQRVTMYENTCADSPDTHPDQREDYTSMKDVCNRKAWASHDRCKCQRTGANDSESGKVYGGPRPGVVA